MANEITVIKRTVGKTAVTLLFVYELTTVHKVGSANTPAGTQPIVPLPSSELPEIGGLAPGHAEYPVHADWITKIGAGDAIWEVVEMGTPANQNNAQLLAAAQTKYGDHKTAALDAYVDCYAKTGDRFDGSA